jgi:hypothetical protein
VDLLADLLPAVEREIFRQRQRRALGQRDAVNPQSSVLVSGCLQCRHSAPDAHVMVNRTSRPPNPVLNSVARRSRPHTGLNDE